MMADNMSWFCVAVKLLNLSSWLLLIEEILQVHQR